MSMKRFGKAAFSIANEVARKLQGTNPSFFLRRFRFPKLFPNFYRLDVVARKASLPSSRNSLLRIARLVVRRGHAARPFAAFVQRKFQWESSHPHRFRRKLLTIPKTQDGIIHRVKHIFTTHVRYNRDLASEDVPQTLDGYEIGENIGYGCNAAVYALRVREGDQEPLKEEVNNDSMGVYPLALKLMFNFELDIITKDDNHIWKSMGTELVPLPDSQKLLQGRMGHYCGLRKKHPNVIRMLTAFVDSFPILPDAQERYPEALPTARDYTGMIIDQPRTLLIVMKRYRMTLRDYVATMPRNYWSGRVMFGQLLEGCVFLYENRVAQRDMKSDNILLDFDRFDEAPHLVISDFGCALANGSWNVEYPGDYISLGGNLSTRAPEIVSAIPGDDSVVDFRLADTWAAGGLGYEIFTRSNPFYSKLKSQDYVEEELPVLPKRLHHAVRTVIGNILRRDPRQRVGPHIAANVISLSLFRFGEDVRSFLKECGIDDWSPDGIKEKTKQATTRAIDAVVGLMAAETMSVRGRESVVSPAELQLRATFLSRVDHGEVWAALGYFFAPAENGRGKTLAEAAASVLVPHVHNGIVHRIASR